MNAKIVHPTTGKERYVKDLRIVFHIISNKGIDEDVKCVEFTVIGDNSEWPDWATYKDFREHNPEIHVDNKE